MRFLFIILVLTLSSCANAPVQNPEKPSQVEQTSDGGYVASLSEREPSKPVEVSRQSEETETPAWKKVGRFIGALFGGVGNGMSHAYDNQPQANQIPRQCYAWQMGQYIEVNCP